MVATSRTAVVLIASLCVLGVVVQGFSPHHHHPASIFSQRGTTTTTATSSLIRRAASTTTVKPPSTTQATNVEDTDVVSETNPLRVIIAGAGVGGLALANTLQKNPTVQVTVLERTEEFKRFGGPIQLASNALRLIEDMDEDAFTKVMEKFTFTGDKENGIKDGIRNEWYAKFDLGTPAKRRNMPYTGVIDRPELQDIYLKSLKPGVVKNGDGVESYRREGSTVTVTLTSGETVEGDVLIGADGIWSAVRGTMRGEPIRGDGSGVSYSGYTVFAGELKYDSFDNGKVGYKVYIGPGQYFVITDIGNGNYQWYAFLARPPGSGAEEEKPDGSSPFLQETFAGWSDDIHHILKATKEHEIEQRDLYDRPPSVLKPWTDENVALLGDAVHAMMPNLGQGGCQAIEDAFVLGQELSSVSRRTQVPEKLSTYRNRRLVRSAAVQGLSRFASDIIIRGFDTPAKIVWKEGEALPSFENFNYAGIVTKMLQPILPLFFSIQFNFLYEGWRNEMLIDPAATIGFLTVGGLVLLVSVGSVGEIGGLGLGLGLDGIFGAEGFEALASNINSFFGM